MTNLYPHNRKAYEAVMKAFNKGDKRVCIVHATGTGKSYVIASVAEHFNNVLIVAPNNFIIDEVRKTAGDRCDYATYISLKYSYPEKKYDLIILDEFHRSGAEKWGDYVKKLIDYNVSAKIFGTSATHIRYLDNHRNIADELFNGNVVSILSLKDAINKKILPKPKYISSLYSIDKEIKTRINRIGKRVISESRSKEIKDKIHGISGMWENAYCVPNVIKKYFNKDMKRVIVFCSTVDNCTKATSLLREWFSDAGYNDVTFYNIDYSESKLKRVMSDFLRPTVGKELKVAVSINMLNEGVHIPNIDGIIMLRSSISRIIIEQQIGRCLTAENSHRTPVILDLVNNIKSIKEICHIDECNTIYSKKGDEKSFAFDVIDECKDLIKEFDKIDDILDIGMTKEECHDIAKQYNTKKAFCNCQYPIYRYAYIHGWIDDICSHMDNPKIWSEDDIRNEALKYNRRYDFMKGSKNAYQAAQRRGIIEEVCSHMSLTRIKWSKEKVLDIALKCKSRTEFRKTDELAYNAAHKHGWLDEACAHMEQVLKKWSYESCVKEAKKCKSRTEFLHSNGGAYNWCRENECLDEVCSHMKKERAPRKWDFDNCKAVSDICNGKADFRLKYYSAYKSCKKHNWLNILFPKK